MRHEARDGRILTIMRTTLPGSSNLLAELLPQPENSRLRLPRVLFAAYPGGRPTGALLRAASLARTFEAEISVLRVLPGDVQEAGGASSSGLAGVLWHAERFVKLARRTRKWCDATLGTALPEGRVLVREGDFQTTVARIALEMEASLVVLPPAEGRSGEQVTAIALEAGVPVLVARAVMSSNVVVAATDLEDARYPVLRQASDLAARFRTGIVAVHNVRREAGFEGCIHDHRRRRLALSREVDSRRKQLVELAAALDARLEPVVVSQLSTTKAILAAARDRDADLVVVGARVSEEEPGPDSTTAVEVVEGSCRSILVMPFVEAHAA